jgi:hypothetical protein
MEETHEEIEAHCLRAFLYEYCATSVNQNISRGYLHGLENMVRRQTKQSDLAKACRAIAFASHGTFLNRPSLRAKGEFIYQDILKSVTQAIGKIALLGSSRASVEMMAVIVLLGMYEVCLRPWALIVMT